MKNKLLFVLASLMAINYMPCHAEDYTPLPIILSWGAVGAAAAATTGLTHQLLKTNAAKDYSAIATIIGISAATTQALLPFMGSEIRKKGPVKDDTNKDLMGVINMVTMLISHAALWKFSPDPECIGRAVLYNLFGGIAGNLISMPLKTLQNTY